MRLIASLSLLLLAAAPAALADCGHDHGAGHDHDAASADQRPVDVVLSRYEAIRQSLITDTTDDVAENAKAIHEAVAALRSDWSAARAGLDGSDDATVKRTRDALPEIESAAKALVEHDSLEDARERFYALSKPLVRWHAGLGGERPIVAYCSMAEKSWLQPDEPLGNPYYGSSMLRCGSVVSR